MISTLPLLCLRQARAMCQPCVSSAPVHGLAASGVSRSSSPITAWAADCHSAGSVRTPGRCGEGETHERDAGLSRQASLNIDAPVSVGAFVLTMSSARSSVASRGIRLRACAGVINR
jgi:hypothetical protein